MSIKAFLSGSLGDDTLTGGSSHDVILGGGGNDLLSGGAGDDFLIGGTGSDRIVGSSGNDVLAAGDVECGLDLAGLRAISSEWSTSRGTTADEAEAADEIFSDDEFDKLTGSSGADWFIISSGDIITDLAKTLAKDGDVITYVS